MWACGEFPQVHPHLFSWSTESIRHCCGFPACEQNSTIKLPWSVVWQGFKYNVWTQLWIASTDPSRRQLNDFAISMFLVLEIALTWWEYKLQSVVSRVLNFLTLFTACMPFSQLLHIGGVFCKGKTDYRTRWHEMVSTFWCMLWSSVVVEIEAIRKSCEYSACIGFCRPISWHWPGREHKVPLLWVLRDWLWVGLYWIKIHYHFYVSIFVFFKVCYIFFKLLLLRNLWLESDNVSLGLI